jgi:predicted RNA-binding protein YlqC (UPF0109 family)
MPNIKSDFELLRGLLQNVISMYVQHTDLLEVEMIQPAEGLIIFVLRVETTDHPKVLGKHGQALRSLETLFRAVGDACGVKISLRLLNPKNTRSGISPPPRDESDNFDSRWIKGILNALLTLLCQSPIEVESCDLPSITTFSAVLPTPISEGTTAALATLMGQFGGKAGRAFYLHLT